MVDTVDTISTKEGDLEASVGLGFINVAGTKVKNAYLRISVPDQSNPHTPPGALYQIIVMGDGKSVLDNGCWVLSDGKIIRYGEDYRTYMLEHLLSRDSGG